MVLQISKLGEYSSNFLTKLQARKELNRIEDRYVKRTNRNVWRSDAEYVDGEYIFTSREQVPPPNARPYVRKSNAPSPKPSDSNLPGSSRGRPATDSSSASDASKKSGSSTTSRLAKRFSTSMPWR